MMIQAERALTAAQQYHLLLSRKRFPGKGKVHSGHMTWMTEIAPAPLSRDYSVRLTYRQGSLPEVFVDDPDLSLLADGDRLPHVYSQIPTRLCLYLPGTREWTPGDAFDDTMLPWAALWLYYYEDWLSGGKTEWRGGGTHPSPSRLRNRRASTRR